MDQDRSDIEDAISRDREQLASTLEALGQKADVKARVHDKVDELRTRVRENAPSGAQDSAETAMRVVRERPGVAAAVGVFFLGVLVGRITRGKS
jgi:ElaB/YqjD/DUF883 family membrane-anchored ribosome-binding protein